MCLDLRSVRSSSLSEDIMVSQIIISHSLGISKPDIIFNKVDFPDHEGHIIAMLDHSVMDRFSLS